METETAANTREDVPTRNGAEAARTRKEDDGVEEARDDKISKDATRATGATRANDDDVSREAYARFVAASAPRYPGPLGPPPGPGMGMHATMSDRMWPADPPGPPPAFAGAASSGHGGSLASNLSELTNDPARVAGAPLSAPLSASAIMNPAYGAYVNASGFPKTFGHAASPRAPGPGGVMNPPPPLGWSPHAELAPGGAGAGGFAPGASAPPDPFGCHL